MLDFFIKIILIFGNLVLCAAILRIAVNDSLLIINSKESLPKRGVAAEPIDWAKMINKEDLTFMMYLAALAQLIGAAGAFLNNRMLLFTYICIYVLRFSLIGIHVGVKTYEGKFSYIIN